MVSSTSDDSFSSLTRASVERGGDGGRPMAVTGSRAGAVRGAYDTGTADLKCIHHSTDTMCVRVA